MHWELSSRWSDSLDYRKNFLSFCFSFHSPFLVAFACLLYTVHVSDMFRAQIRAGEEMTTTTVIHRVWVSSVCISFKHMLMTFYKHVWRHSILLLSLSLSLAFPFFFFFVCAIFLLFFFPSPFIGHSAAGAFCWCGDRNVSVSNANVNPKGSSVSVTF